MRLNIFDIPDDGLQQELVLPIAINDSAKPDMAHVFLKVFRFGKKILVEGTLKISVSLNCSRCLRDFSYPADTAFRDEYEPAEEIKGEDDQELTEQELDLSFYSNDELDIPEIIKEQVILSIPMKPLCNTDCQGICPKCGKDLNDGACGCKEEGIDPRLAPLNKLKELMKDCGTS